MAALLGGLGGHAVAQLVLWLWPRPARLPPPGLVVQAADFEAYGRARKEQGEAVARALEALLLEMLPILDNLDRAAAVSLADGDTAAKAVVDGLGIVQRQFLAVLDRRGDTA